MLDKPSQKIKRRKREIFGGKLVSISKAGLSMNPLISRPFLQTNLLPTSFICSQDRLPDEFGFTGMHVVARRKREEVGDANKDQVCWERPEDKDTATIKVRDKSGCDELGSCNDLCGDRIKDAQEREVKRREQHTKKLEKTIASNLQKLMEYQSLETKRREQESAKELEGREKWAGEMEKSRSLTFKS
nr:hypothetical protein [Tanacetum cinerariifolium]